MLIRNQLGRKRQRLRWIHLAGWIVLASSGEALFFSRWSAAAASWEKDTELLAASDKTPDQTVISSGVRLSGSAIASLAASLGNAQKKTPPLDQAQASDTNPLNGVLSDAELNPNALTAQSITQQQPTPLQNPQESVLEGFPHRGAADLLLDTGENREREDSDKLQSNTLGERAPQAQQLEAESQPKQAEDESDTQQTNGDPDLGILRLRQQELPPPVTPPKPAPPAPQRQSTPILHLLPRISYFQTSNVFSSVDPVGDGLIYPSLMLWAVPQLGRNTFLTPSIEGSLIRYIKEPKYNYNLLRFRTGISQRLSPRMFGEIGWTNQGFYRAEVGDRFLNEHIAYLSLSRQDQLTRRLRLNSYYDFRVSFANPDSRSRIINSLYLSLNYSFQTNLQVAMDYQFERSDFTVSDRYDQYHRIMGRLTYGVLRDSQISVSGGVTVGGSSEPFIDFDSLFFSVTYSVDFPIY
ncbi:hypothetical protein [Microseira wollei]|uniref:DUF481 domain-containing protein n=1 Tax=Microseira wollei NIES-4236 TaxID=2530354 RepID=A0AAV3X7H4_9CYAN|nr:hypothetical protein [Microseira wollei]GET38318.1 hypothetical protein MiSe_30740 [Microseira wollei NIES-4236]